MGSHKKSGYQLNDFISQKRYPLLVYIIPNAIFNMSSVSERDTFPSPSMSAALIASSLKVIIFNAAFSASDASVKSTFPSKLVSPDRLEELYDIFKVVFSIRGFSPILFPA